MKHISFLLVILFCSMANIFSQDTYSFEYGKITPHELSMTEYEGDKEAEAVVVYEKGENYFHTYPHERQFFMYQQKSVKIKILKSGGLDYANIEIPYFKDGSDRETIEDLEARVYNFDNNQITETKLNKKNIFEEKLDDNTFVKKIALSDVREGSVIEYKYTIKSPFLIHVRTWNFQKKIPVIHSHLRYKAIPYYEYTYILKGTNSFTEYRATTLYDKINIGGGIEYSETQYDFEIDSIPAFRDESFISSPKDFMISLNFQLSRIYKLKDDKEGKSFRSTWPELCKELLKSDHFGNYIKSSKKEGEKIIPTLDIQDLVQLEKTKKIVSYVKKMYNWDGDNSIYTTDKVSDFLKLKKGNSADINLFLAGILNAANIEANPIILSTRSNGAISFDHPFLRFFDYTIVEAVIDSQKYYLDATKPTLYFGQLPMKCSNVKALVVKPKEQDEWIILHTPEETLTEKIIHLTILPEEEKIKVDVDFSTWGYDALYYKDIYFEEKELGLKQAIEKRNDIKLESDVVVKNTELDSKQFDFSCNYDLTLEKTPDKLFVKPFAGQEITKNPFTQTNRTLPIDLVYISKDKYTSIINIPEGYEVEHLPKEVNHNGRIFYCTYLAKDEGNQIIVTSEVESKRNMYPAEAYVSLKNTLDILIKQLTDVIVFKKKGVS